MQGGWQYNARGVWVTSPTGLTRCIDCEESPEAKECGMATELRFKYLFSIKIIISDGMIN